MRMDSFSGLMTESFSLFKPCYNTLGLLHIIDECFKFGNMDQSLDA